MLRVRLPVLCCACIIIRAHAAAYLKFHNVEAVQMQETNLLFMRPTLWSKLCDHSMSLVFVCWIIKKSVAILTVIVPNNTHLNWNINTITARTIFVKCEQIMCGKKTLKWLNLIQDKLFKSWVSNIVCTINLSNAIIYI